MKISILPKTILGKWSVGLAISFILFFALLAIFAATGQEGGNTFLSNLFLAIPGTLAVVSAVATFFTGIVSVIFMKERAVFVFVAMIIGLLVIVFILGDLLFPET